MSEVRLIDANEFVDGLQKALEIIEADKQKREKSDNPLICGSVEAINVSASMIGTTINAIAAQPTVDAVPREWWNELESTVSKLVEDNDNFPENKQFYDCARFLLNLMGVIERRSDGRV